MATTQLKGKAGDMSAEDFASNLKTIQEQGAGTYTYAGSPGVSNTITSEQMAPAPNLKLPETKSTPTLSTGISAEVENQALNYKDQALEDKEAETKKARDEYINLMKSSIGETGLTDQAYKAEGVDTKKKTIDTINAKILDETISSKKRIEEIEKNKGGMFGGAVAQEVNKIKRESASYMADLAVEKYIADNDYYGAKAVADRSVAAKMEEQRQNIDMLKTIWEDNKDDLSVADNRAYQAMITKKEREADKEEKELQLISDLSVMALQNPNTPTSVVTAMRNAKTATEAMEIGKDYLSSPETDIVKLDNGNTVVVDKRTGKIINTLGGGSDTDPITSSGIDFKSLVNTTSSLETTVTGKKDIANQMNNYIKNQDYASAYNQIANTVENSLLGDTKTRFANARIDREILSGFKIAIENYKNAGGEMSLLKGTAEEIKRKLGAVNDPKLTSIAVQLEREFQTYRLNMTGAAFTPQESREYASVNPNSKKSLDLNLAVIDGALNQLNNRVDGTIKAKVPQSVEIKKLLEVPKTNEEAKAKIDSIYLNTDDATAKMLDDLYLTGKYDDLSILEYLKNKGIIK